MCVVAVLDSHLAFEKYSARNFKPLTICCRISLDVRTLGISINVSNNVFTSFQTAFVPSYSFKFVDNVRSDVVVSYAVWINKKKTKTRKRKYEKRNWRVPQDGSYAT